MEHKLKILAGPPGTGKTTRLLQLVEQALEKNVAPDKIGFFSFTRKAAEEAKSRAMHKFGLRARMLPYFRTLHSMAFWALGLSRDAVVSRENLKAFGHIMGLQLSGFYTHAEGLLENTGDDRLLFLENLARVRNVPLKQQWEEVHYDDVSWYQLERVQKALSEYKQSNSIYDYTDMLTEYVSRGDKPEFDLLIIDEAQDLSVLQWALVRQLAENAKQVYIAGDDDQAIYRWAGAEVDQFIGLDGEYQVLDQSYRIPRAVHQVVTNISNLIHERREKVFAPKEEEGSVEWHNTIQSVDMSQGTWLVLARNKYLLEEARKECAYHGYWYEHAGQTPVPKSTIKKVVAHTNHGGAIPWYDAFDSMPEFQKEYLRAALRRGEKVTKEPRIKLSTIHGSKGGEAQNVLLYTDVSLKAYNQLRMNSDDEHRVFYVGASRAKENLHIMTPATQLYFPM